MSDISVPYETSSFSQEGRAENFYYKVSGLSMIGKSHLASGTENQDSFGVFTDSNSVAMAVADGVGSCSHSKFGSKAATETIKSLQNAITHGPINVDERINVASFVINEWQSRIRGDLSDYATTLKFGVFFPHFLLMGGIGDGAVFISIDRKEYSTFGADDLFLNWTDALTKDVDNNKFHVLKIDIPEQAKSIQVFLGTDGITNEIVYGKEIHFLKYVANKINENADEYNREIRDWLESLQWKNGDDKTVLIFTATRSTI